MIGTSVRWQTGDSTGVDRSGLERAEVFLTVMPSAFRFIATGVCHMARARRGPIYAWQ